MFKAYVFDNQNTLQSGDSIDGGAGTDTLLADLGSSNKFAITPETKSVEIVKFRVQANDPTTDGSENNTGRTGATIDAERMQGVKEFWSSNSRADLKVEDVRINSNQVTIGMENTDAGKVDMRVYFDNQNLVPNGKSGAQLSLELIEGKIVEPTLVSYIPQISWLGIYPYAETLTPQLVLLLAALLALWRMKQQSNLPLSSVVKN